MSGEKVYATAPFLQSEMRSTIDRCSRGNESKRQEIDGMYCPTGNE
ncbi:hypothetical protein [Mesorhizobium prunaredense]|nr:hypothetical protein [Mesorhizobium prunaredense]